MADLQPEHQTFIVTRLACYATPSNVRDEFQDKFKITLTLQQICYYNPLTAQGHDQLDAQWKDLFVTTRTEFQKQLQAIPVADMYYRLFRLQQIIDDELLSKSPKTVMKAMEQAAKEMGGMYVKPEERGGEGGDPNAIPQVFEDAMTKIYGGDDAAQPGEQDTGGACGPVHEQPAAPNA